MVCRVEVEATVPFAAADTVYSRIRSFEEYVNYTDAVRSVEVISRHGNTLISDWSVNFRGGVLKWTERDDFDDENKSIYFEQTDGDFVTMNGTWVVTKPDDSVRANFAAEFDMGIPTLEPIINPVAMRAMKDNIGRILQGLLGHQIDLTSTCTDLAAQPGGAAHG